MAIQLTDAAQTLKTLFDRAQRTKNPKEIIEHRAKQLIAGYKTILYNNNSPFILRYRSYREQDDSINIRIGLTDKDASNNDVNESNLLLRLSVYSEQDRKLSARTTTLIVSDSANQGLKGQKTTFTDMSDHKMHQHAKAAIADYLFASFSEENMKRITATFPKEKKKTSWNPFN